MSVVNVEVKSISIPTYQVESPELSPFFLEKRVFQGSSGKTYPLPFYNRVKSEKADQEWQVVFIENDYIEVSILPQIGGRIYTAVDKSNGYDFIYRQDVIKPALVGLAGPWISGGIEFNWPQHHRPATYMKAEFEVEKHDDGSVTVWLSDHDPLQHMKGMHGVCLHPDKAYIELKVRAYNRTEYTQTFLWWANIATRVHEEYQSFFPQDVHMVADHAKRALSTYPHCTDKYYGVDYQKRNEEGVPKNEIPSKFTPYHCKGEIKNKVNYKPNDLSWYANIPVPTSYMCIGSEGDFCGGYDHAEKAGIVHVANHHISPGKKQWTWGNHDFGYAWDQNLSDSNEPYIELMAGVYTDNQPDFSYLMPGETKTWSQYFYPFKEIGTAKYADKDFAVNLELTPTRVLIGVAATSSCDSLQVELKHSADVIYSSTVSLSPVKPFVQHIEVSPRIDKDGLELVITDETGRRITVKAVTPQRDGFIAESATEPPAPKDIESCDELYITGQHLEQYRHATRSPELYWQEALSRDPDDSRCNNAMGLKSLGRGEFRQAIEFFKTAVKRLTKRNPNPIDGEAYYNLGLTLRLVGKIDDSYAALYKSTWNMAWRAPAYHALAEIDCLRSNWPEALEHIEYSLKYNVDNLRARNLLVMILRKLGNSIRAEAVLSETRRLDKLDVWSRYLAKDDCLADSSALIDFALDFERCGFYQEALEVMKSARSEPTSGTGPTLLYLMGWIEEKQGNTVEAEECRKKAQVCDSSYCFPSRYEEMLALHAALAQNYGDARAAYYLGNLYYNNKRHEDALQLWLKSVENEPENAIAWRNIGLAAYNARHDETLALDSYNKAVKMNPTDPRLIYERDQLFKRVGIDPEQRLDLLNQHSELIDQRDELLIEYCTLLNLLGRPEETAKYLYNHNFQPWEGGEGMALGLHVSLNLQLGKKSLAANLPVEACEFLEKALTSPANLGEAKHLLANHSDVHYWLGVAYGEVGDTKKSIKHFEIAAETKGDFQTMEVRDFSEMTYYSALAMKELEQDKESAGLILSLEKYADELKNQKAEIDYFATSLPNLLLFDDDLDEAQQIRADFMKAQVLFSQGDTAKTEELIRGIIKKNPSHEFACDFLVMLERNEVL